MAYQLQIKNGTLEEWIASNPILAEGEMGLVIGDSKNFVVGDGVTHFDELTQLPFGLDAYEVLKRNGYKGTKSDFCRQLDSSLRMPEQQAGTLTNAGAGWNSFTFMKEFSEDVYVILTPQEAAVFASVKNITKQGFHYCLYDASGNTVSSNVVVNYMATAVSELNMAQAIAKAAGLNPFDFDNLTDLFASHAAEVVGNEAAYNLTKRSGMAAGRYICHLTGLNPVTYHNMVSVAGDAPAMNTVAVTEEALTFIVMAPGAYDSIRLGTMPMSKYLVGLLSLSPEGYSTVTNLLDDSIALTALVADLTAMQAFTGSEIACAELTVHETACSAVAGSDIAMTAVAGSDIAMTAVAGSAIAYNKIFENANAFDILYNTPAALRIIANDRAAVEAMILDRERVKILAESSTAMGVLAESSHARSVLLSSAKAWEVVTSTDAFIAKYAVGCLESDTYKPADFANMAAIASNSSACTALSASQIAMNALSASRIARNALLNNSVSWKVVTDSNVFIAKYSIGCLESSSYTPANFANMAAIVSNSGALTALAASATARDILYKNKDAFDILSKVDMAIAKFAIGSLNNSSYKPANFANVSAIISNSGALSAVAASSTAMGVLAGSSTAMNVLLKSDTARSALCGSNYLQSNYDKILSATANTTYFTRYIDYVDSGNFNTVDGKTKTSSTTPNQSLYLSIKVGGWGKTFTDARVCVHLHLQTQGEAGRTSVPANTGGGYNSDTVTDGGLASKAVCIGGMKMTETGDVYTRGWFVYAK